MQHTKEAQTVRPAGQRHGVVVTSIDGDAEWPTLQELIDEAPTNWSDESPIPVWDADDERIGTIDPDSGEFTAEPTLSEAQRADLLVCMAWTVHKDGREVARHEGVEMDFHACLTAIALRDHYGSRAQITVAVDGAFVAEVPKTLKAKAVARLLTEARRRLAKC